MTAVLLTRPSSTEPAEPPTAVAVAGRDLLKRFPDGTVALDGTSVECAPGHITVLLGPSGCGKTTLLRCVAGLEQPTAGSISIGGRDVTAVDAGLRGVAMVFQNHALYPDKTAAGNLAFPLRMAGVPKRERAGRVAEVAELLKLGGLLKRKPNQLSGGQRQRVGIGRALIRRPDVLLMDEPFSSLDAELRVEMRAEFLALQRRLGMTTLYVTHDQVEALSLADQLIVLRDGRVEQAAAAEEMFRRPATSFVATFLGGMNLLTGPLRDGSILVADHADPLRVPIQTLSEDGDIKLGIRPEDLHLGAGGRGDVTLDLAVRLTELLGRERLVHGQIGSTRVKFRVHADTPIEARMTVHARAADLHVFGVDGVRVQVEHEPA